MSKSLLSWKNELERKPILDKWVTNEGHELYGTLSVVDNHIRFHVYTKDLNNLIVFENITRKDYLGNRLTLHPFPQPSNKRLCNELSPSTYVPIQYIVNEKHSIQPNSNDNRISIRFAPFLWGKITRTGKSVGREYKAVRKDTKIGEITLWFSIIDSSRADQPLHSRSVSSVNISINFIKKIDHKGAFKWRTRISNFLTFICQEKIPTYFLEVNEDDIFAPELVQKYKPASYAHKKLLYVKDFRELFAMLVVGFVNNYDEIDPILTDMCNYYGDYAAKLPDSIQLSRLFTSLEQASNHAAKAMKKAHTRKARKNEKEYDEYVKNVFESNIRISNQLEGFIRSSRQHYKKLDDQPSSRAKIKHLAEFIYEKYKINNNLIFDNKVKVVWEMRNLIVHGNIDKELKIQQEFYANDDYLRQHVEQIVRAYILTLMGANKKIITEFSEPLRAVIRSIY